MTDAQEPVEKQLFDMAQRIGMRIAAEPNARDAMYEIAEREIRDMALRLGSFVKDADGFVDLQMRVVRDVVARIDLSGNAQGGKA